MVFENDSKAVLDGDDSMADWLVYADYTMVLRVGPTFIGVLKNADMSDATSVYNGYWEYGILYFRFPCGCDEGTNKRIGFE